MEYSLSDITNTLEYKLGNAILSHKRITGGGGNSYYIDYNTLKLIFKLRKAKFTYRKQQKFYEKIILFFPQYEKEPVFIRDANELIKPFGITTSLKYKIGKIIKSRQRRWYKGGFYHAIKEAKNALATFNKAKILQDTIQNIYTQAYSNVIKNADNSPTVITTFDTKVNTHAIIDLTYATAESLAFIEKNLSSIQAWIESQEFKNQYVDSKHPYPPLLNPNNLNYHTISAESAWDLNIPLPSNYEFIVVVTGFSGHSALIRTLRKCNINIALDHYDHSLLYHVNYIALLKNGYNAINLACCSSDSNNLLYKFLYLLPKKTPILYLVRDPIEKLRSTSGFESTQKAYWTIDLQKYDKSLLYGRVCYGINYTLPFKQKIIKIINRGLYDSHKVLTILQQKGFNDIESIDMKEILPKTIFATLQKLSQRFGFSIPYAKEEYEKIYYMSYAGYMFPLLCEFLLHTKVEIYIVLKEYFDNTESFMFPRFTEYCNITNLFNFTMPPFLYPIAIITHKQYLKDLQDNRESLQALNPTLQQLLNDMYQQIQIEESKKTSEKEILQLLQTDIPSRQILKKAIDTEIAYIKDVRPDIVQSWKYYQKFEKICEDSMLL